jgi:mono/diheme cytochrome c family protein
MEAHLEDRGRRVQGRRLQCGARGATILLMPGRRALQLFVLFMLVGAAAALGTNRGSAATGARTRAAVEPRVAMGAHLFVQFACSGCHGPQGRGGVSPDVPALARVGKALTVAQLSSIIKRGLGESANPKKPFMPVWGPVISRSQVADLVAYVRAGLPRVRYAEPVPVPRDQGAAVAGSALYVRYGCINCHGPNGLGGVPNPQSPDKSIPPLAGQDFRKEFNTDAKIVAFIRSGSVIGKQPIVSMPHWGGIIPARDLEALVAYLKTLK